MGISRLSYTAPIGAFFYGNSEVFTYDRRPSQIEQKQRTFLCGTEKKLGHKDHRAVMSAAKEMPLADAIDGMLITEADLN